MKTRGHCDLDLKDTSPSNVGKKIIPTEELSQGGESCKALGRMRQQEVACPAGLSRGWKVLAKCKSRNYPWNIYRLSQYQRRRGFI